MQVPKNRLKAALAAGERQFGLWLALAHPASAEIAATAGFDWCLIDGEHGPNDIPLILDQVRAMNGGGATPVVRVPVGDPRLIKQVLDLGVQSLVVPMVETGEQAEAMVRATRYPPEGMRGVGAAMARAGHYGARTNVVAEANAQICLLVQAESRRALENLDAILETDVDGVFIGPADLSADMGYPGRTDAAEVQEAIDGAIRKIKGAGKAVGLIAFDLEQAQDYVRRGAQFMAVGGDVNILAKGIRAAAAAVDGMRGL